MCATNFTQMFLKLLIFWGENTGMFPNYRGVTTWDQCISTIVSTELVFTAWWK